jgi:hypothetical protein
MRFYVISRAFISCHLGTLNLLLPAFARSSLDRKRLRSEAAVRCRTLRMVLANLEHNRLKNAWEPVFHFCRGKEIKFRPKAAGHKSDDVVVCSNCGPTRPNHFC